MSLLPRRRKHRPHHVGGCLRRDAGAAGGASGLDGSELLGGPLLGARMSCLFPVLHRAWMREDRGVRRE